jgi:hypothetical protein
MVLDALCVSSLLLIRSRNTLDGVMSSSAVVIPPAVTLAALSTLSFPFMPICSAVHLSISKYFAVHLHFCMHSTVLRKLMTIFCPSCPMLVLRVFITA